MANEVTYRRNVLSISSVDAFFRIRGGFRNGVRDVYFIRALGEQSEMVRLITETDSEMCSCAAMTDILYRRISAFKTFVSNDLTDFYLKSYEYWKTSGFAEIRAKAPDQEKFHLFLDNALCQVLQQYRLLKGRYSETAERNFVVKLMFWLDDLFADEIRQWTEKKTVKIAADNITKEQEYLFLYMVTFLGFDVLIYNTRADIALPEQLKNLSQEIVLGQFGQSVIPPFDTQESETSPQPQNQQKESQLEISETSRPQSRTQEQVALQTRPQTGHSTVSMLNTGRADERAEKSFEELARMASSVVMIAVLDRTGKAVSTGSGIVIGKNGYILTNYHVVSGGSVYAVRIEEDEQIYLTKEVMKYHPN